MISGTVIGLQARIGIILYPPGRAELKIECVVDTGFEGFLTLPISVVTDLSLPYLGQIKATLADNARIATNMHEAVILWHGMERVIPVLSMGRRPLIGTALLQDYHLSIDFYDGGIVLVDEIM